MRAAARGEPYAIAFTGRAQYDYAPDVGRAFVTAAASVREGAAVYNVPGAPASVEDVIAAIRDAAPGAAITAAGAALPFPEELEAEAFDRDVGPFPRTPLAVGVAATVAHFRAAA
jgi:nucleoside-diphosphate-sugar epimerase